MTPWQRHVIDSARKWKDTPFRHQGYLRGVGADCFGLLVGLAGELGMGDYSEFMQGYSKNPNGRLLISGLTKYLQPVAPIEDFTYADVLLLRWHTKMVGQHVAIVTDHPGSGYAIVHSYEMVGKVVEHRLSEEWWGRVMKVFRIPEGEL